MLNKDKVENKRTLSKDDQGEKGSYFKGEI